MNARTRLATARAGGDNSEEVTLTGIMPHWQTLLAHDTWTEAVPVATLISITVTPVNDVPSFTKGAGQTVLEDAGVGALEVDAPIVIDAK